MDDTGGRRRDTKSGIYSSFRVVTMDSSCGEHDKVEIDESDLPRGVIRQRGGWEGEELEMRHQQEVFRSGRDPAIAAVDIRQFQNHVVGEGYQARHVVRQPTVSDPSTMKIKDMTGDKVFRQEATKTGRLDTGERNYIDNDGLREFRKEIESLLR